MMIDETPEGRRAYGGQTEQTPLNGNQQNSWPRCLLIMSIFLFLLSIILTLMLATFKFNNCDTHPDDVCLTPECVREAAMTLEYLNTDVNPCDDFYKFSCGNYLTKQIPDNEILISVLGDIDDKYREQLRTLIEHDIFPSKIPPFSILNTFYENCMDKNGIERNGLQTISKIFEKLGGWPVVKGDKWKTDMNWIDMANELTKEGFFAQYFFNFGSGFDLANTKQPLFFIDEPKLGLSTAFLKKGFKDAYVQAYYKYMTDVAIIFGANKTRAEKDMREVMELHIDLARSFVAPEELRNITKYHNPMTMKEIEDNYGQFWNEYFQKIVHEEFAMQKTEVITVYHPSYLKKLSEILQHSDERTLANFIFWRSMESVVQYLPRSIREAELNFKNVREGITERTPRWKECIDNSFKLMNPIVNFVYHQVYFNETVSNDTLKTPTKNIVTHIHNEFLNMLKKADWMDKETRQRAWNKANAMVFEIADEDRIESLERLREKYSKIQLKRDGNSLQSYLSIPKQELVAINNHVDYILDPDNIRASSAAVDGPALLNPVYGLFYNKIYIPAGIIQAPFMDDKRPQYINYATLGFVVGHEMTHGFGDQGHQFDENGNLNEWWGQATKEQLSSRTQCLIYQYGNYTSDDIGEKLNGIVSIDENMADNGGLKVAHVAYENWVKANAPEKKLPGLKYSPLQLFWIKLAQNWCIKYRPQTLRELIVTDQHSPEEFRIRGSLSNSHEFAKDFQCPVGSKMNPVKKCSVW